MSVPKTNHKVLLYTVILICNNVLICLQDFLGGDTTFLDLEESERIEVEPRTGEHFFFFTKNRLSCTNIETYV